MLHGVDDFRLTDEPSHLAGVFQRKEKSLVVLEQMVLEIEALQPGAAPVETLLLAESVEQLALGPPSEPVVERERITLQFFHRGLPVGEHRAFFLMLQI